MIDTGLAGFYFHRYCTVSNEWHWQDTWYPKGWTPHPIITIVQNCVQALSTYGRRLLNYKTCLDTKPVLYRDRYCSLTDVLEESVNACYVYSVKKILRCSQFSRLSPIQTMGVYVFKRPIQVDRIYLYFIWKVSGLRLCKMRVLKTIKKQAVFLNVKLRNLLLF